MSKRESDRLSGPERHATIVVRAKRSEGEDEHHGGAWKIAYADFMTAMMAFFLVMWLVNAADEKVIVQVAAYFNPLKLTEKTPSQRGLEDGNVASVPQGGKAAPREPSVSDEQSRSSPRERRKPSPNNARRAEQDGPSVEELDMLASQAAGYIASPGSNTTRKDPRVRDPWHTDLPRAFARARPDTKASEAGEPAGAAPEEVRRGERVAPNTAEALENDIKDLLARVRGQHPEIEVRMTSEGVLVSVMDNGKFGMFPIASSEPRPELVALLREVGRLLAQRRGAVVVTGHTDGRPFRSVNNDNWRLSTSRAHVARLVLTRGGVDDVRFERIEGRADRALRNRSDPEAAENRRIDILLRVAP